VRAVQEPPVTCTGPSTTAWLIGLASQFVMVGLSGGLRSPFLVATIGPLSSMLVVYGWSRETKTAMRIVFLGAASLILLPTRWLGPSVPEPYFSQLAGLALFSVAFFQTAYLIAMTRALNESHSRIDRAREQMAQEALARARELEHMSAQLSHELKNPLGAIKALVQLARREACEDQSRERLQGGGEDRAARGPGAGRGARLRPRHAARGAGARRHSLLHHPRTGNGPGRGDGEGRLQAAWRLARVSERGGPRHDRRWRPSAAAGEDRWRAFCWLTTNQGCCSP